MINTFIIYSIKTSVALLVFYVLYVVCLKNDTFLKTKRLYFLLAPVFALLYPLFSLELPVDEASNFPAYWMQLQAVAITSGDRVSVNGESITFAVYLAVVTGLLARFTIQLSCILKTRFSHVAETENGLCIVRLKGNITPFSFFKWIFVSGRNEQKETEIIVHEGVHARQYHSADVLLYELLCVFLWWNPFMWLMKREMKINLEYLADKGVLDKGYDPKGYQYKLLEVSKYTGMPLVNNFNVSQLKKRIMMMNRKESKSVAKAKYLLAAPVMALLMLGNVVQASPEILTLSPTIIEPVVVNTVVNDTQQDNKPYITAEEMPKFPGGDKALLEYIRNNLKYPESAYKAKKEGHVIVTFVVDADGSITNTEVIRRFDPDCDAEAERIVKDMPKWTPGKDKGVAVPVYYSLPVVFRLK